MSEEYTYSMREGAEEFPLMVHVELTYVCNSRCPHCPYTPANSDIRARNWERGNRHMPDVLFKKLADEVGEHKRFLRVTAGGEPMMHPHCVDLLCYAKSVGCSIGLITNGSLITPPVADALLIAGVDVLEFSVDAADKDTYEKVRPGLNWAQILRNVDYVVSRRNSEKLETRVVVSVINQKEVEASIGDIEKFWQDKVDHVIIRKFLSWGIVNRSGSGDDTPFLDQHMPCPYPYERCAVTQEGDVILCGYDIEGVQTMGNIKDTTIKKIWNSPAYRALRENMWAKRFDEIPFCRDCSDRIYRSWDHSYLKTLVKSQAKRDKTLQGGE